MRTLTFLTLASIATSTLTYLFMEEKAGNEQNRSVVPSNSNAPLTDQELRNGLDRFIALLQRYQQTHQLPSRQGKSGQNPLFTQMVATETRLHTSESGKKESPAIQGVADVKGDYVDSLAIPEQDIAEWMEDSLQYGNNDRESTELAAVQALRSLAGVPGVTLQKMQCGDRFCRAKLKYDKGRKHSVLDLFGRPPFMNDGFAREDADSNIALYFVHPGESIEEIRSEIAQETLH